MKQETSDGLMTDAFTVCLSVTEDLLNENNRLKTEITDQNAALQAATEKLIQLSVENAELKMENGQMKDDINQLQIGKVALIQRVAELELQLKKEID